jgi:hypothetical protein
MSDKIFFIDEHYKRWEEDISKAAELLSDPKYYLEGILVLSCYIGAFAAARYPTMHDGAAYVKFVLDYSGKRSFFEQVDLLFFYQWPRSKLRENGNYKHLKQHSEIVEALKPKYGNEGDIKTGTRYVSISDFINTVRAATIPNFDEQNLRDKLPLFSLSELLYRYVRCDAVHNADFPFIDKVSHSDGRISYRGNHIITGSVLIETTHSACRALWDECKAKGKSASEL